MNDPDIVPIHRSNEPRPEPDRPDPLAKWRRFADDPALSHWASELNEAHQLVARSHKHALAFAVKAGAIINGIKNCLAHHSSLMPWKVYRQLFTPEISLRTTNNYLACYAQVNIDSSICYPSISACLKTYAKAHPRCRLKVRSKEMLDKAEPPKPEGAVKDLIDEQKSYLKGTFAEWLCDPPLHVVKAHVLRHGYTLPKDAVHRQQVRAYLGSAVRLLDWLQSAEIGAEEQSWLVEYCRRILRTLHEKTLLVDRQDLPIDAEG